MNFQNGSQANGTQPTGALANYTLPGVISYLTSEFTSLERFKIMTNLEKSEMKYQISQLTAELNALRFVNDKQALRIKELEAELGKSETELDEKEGEEETSVKSEVEGEKSQEVEPKEVAADSEESEVTEKVSEEVNGKSPEKSESQTKGIKGQTQKSQTKKSKTSDEKKDGKKEHMAIPHVDFESLRLSRQNLNSSINEIIRLLKPPSSLGLLEDHLGCDSNEFDELLDDSVQFTFDTPNPVQSPQAGIFSRYTLGSDDVLADQKVMFEKEVKEEEERVPKPDESDAETVIVDEPDGPLLRGE